MAWIKDGKLLDIVQGLSLEGTKIKLRNKIQLGWQLEGKIVESGNGYACLVTKELNRR